MTPPDLTALADQLEQDIYWALPPDHPTDSPDRRKTVRGAAAALREVVRQQQKDDEEEVSTRSGRPVTNPSDVHAARGRKG